MHLSASGSQLGEAKSRSASDRKYNASWQLCSYIGRDSKCSPKATEDSFEGATEAPLWRQGSGEGSMKRVDERAREESKAISINLSIRPIDGRHNSRQCRSRRHQAITSGTANRSTGLEWLKRGLEAKSIRGEGQLDLMAAFLGLLKLLICTISEALVGDLSCNY